MAMFYFDPAYFLFIGPAMLFALWAQFRVKEAYGQMSRVAAGAGVSGARAAQHLLERSGVSGVRIEQTQAHLGDHYDPKAKVLRLSPEVYNGRSIAALGIAAHEAGHALQDKAHYGPLKLRNGIVPLASLGGNASYFIIFLGLIGGSFGLVMTGIALFSAVVLFQLINLPVEFDASRRARQMLLQTGLVSPQEDRSVKKVLDAAAMTYVAATVTAILTLLYYLLRFGGAASSDR